MPTANIDLGAYGRSQAIAASVAKTTTASLASGSKITYDLVDFDPFTLWDSANQRFKAVRAGKYRINGAAICAGAANGNFYIEVRKNGNAASS